MKTLFTARADALRQLADQIERDAAQSLNAWIVLGQTDRYSEAMRQARSLRGAASERSICVRREMLRNSGFTFA